MDDVSRTVRASLLVIGDEILSGRTKDKNIGHIAEVLTTIGIDLVEVRIVPDKDEPIIAAVQALSQATDYLFTTGGIGPTHDDITADCVAAAFGLPIDVDPRAVALLQERYAPGELNESRLRMARIPQGAELIPNPISKAPGFRLGNVIVMAGVPAIMQVMLDAVLPSLPRGARLVSTSIDARGLPEGIYASPLAALAREHPGTIVGSYPHFTGSGFRNEIVVRARDPARLEAAAAAVRALVAELAPDTVPL